MPQPDSIVRCIAVRDGRVAALGADAARLRRDLPPGCEVLDFPDGCVLPGFWDTHVHVAETGQAAASCLLYDAGSIQEIVRRVADHAGRHPGGGVIAARAGNLDPAALAEGRLPAAGDLDRAARDRPVVICDVNKCVGNTAALAAAGVTDATGDPPGGRIDRDGDGRPTGTVWFAPAKALLAKLLPSQRPEDFPRRFVAGLEALAACGITTAVEAAASVEEIQAVQRLDAEGRLPCRVILQPEVTSPEQLTDLARSGLAFAQALGPATHVGPVKIFFDRFVMHRSARMAEPYEGEPHNTGGYFLSPPELRSRLAAAAEMGFPAAVHVTGDRGAAEALEAFARALDDTRGRGPRGSFLIHAYFPPEGLPERMAELGIGLSAQPTFLYHWADTLEHFVGRTRAERFYPLEEYLAAGVAVGAGSDSPIVEPSPLSGMHAMATRRSASGRVWGAEHALSPAQAMGLYTHGAAGLLPWSGVRGGLAIGEPADFVVLDRHPATAQPQELRSIRVLATFVAGRRTFPA